MSLIDSHLPHAAWINRKVKHRKKTEKEPNIERKKRKNRQETIKGQVYATFMDQYNIEADQPIA